MVAPNTDYTTTSEVFSAIHTEAKRVAFFLITQKPLWDNDLIGG